MSNLGKYTKAIVGAIIAALSAYQVAQADGLVTQGEWVTIAVAFLTALGIVWGVPNKPDTPASPSTPFVVTDDNPIILNDAQEG